MRKTLINEGFSCHNFPIICFEFFKTHTKRRIPIFNSNNLKHWFPENKGPLIKFFNIPNVVSLRTSTIHDQLNIFLIIEQAS